MDRVSLSGNVGRSVGLSVSELQLRSLLLLVALLRISKAKCDKRE